MATKIEWVARPGTTPETWNPVTGCTKVSPGCKNCYASRMAKRLAGRFGYPVDEPFRVTLHPDRLEQPLQWRKPRTVFVCNMGDLFHNDVPFADIWSIWKIMRQCQQHTFLVLTKRAKRMADDVLMFYCANEKPLPNVWGMVSVENQATADERIPLLLQTPFAVRGVSCEPLLGLIDFNDTMLNCLSGYCGHPCDDYFEGQDCACARSNPPNPKIDWIIAGGESGPGARPMHPDWARGLRDQCQAAGVPFFFKQHGAWVSGACDQTGKLRNHGYFCADGKWMSRSQRKDTAIFMSRIGKKAAGRLLDGREWNEWPNEKGNRS